MLTSIYKGFTRFNQLAYRQIVARAPKSKTPTPRFPVGFVAGHIKLMERRRGKYRYQVVGVPGASSVGSRAWRAWVVIQALHYGWRTLPFERKPTRKKTLGIPVFPGMRVRPRNGQQVLPRRRVIQARQIRKNPWISRVWKSLEPQFRHFLRIAFQEMEAKRRKVRIA
jgi:hypothetical protein